MVSSFDLSNPDVPVARDVLWCPGYGNVVSATDTYLFVSTQNPTRRLRESARQHVSAGAGAAGFLRRRGLRNDDDDECGGLHVV